MLRPALPTTVVGVRANARWHIAAQVTDPRRSVPAHRLHTGGAMSHRRFPLFRLVVVAAALAVATLVVLAPWSPAPDPARDRRAEPRPAAAPRRAAGNAWRADLELARAVSGEPELPIDRLTDEEEVALAATADEATAVDRLRARQALADELVDRRARALRARGVPVAELEARLAEEVRPLTEQVVFAAVDGDPAEQAELDAQLATAIRAFQPTPADLELDEALRAELAPQLEDAARTITHEEN